MRTLLTGAATLGLILFIGGCSDDAGNEPDAGFHRPDAYIGPCQDDPVPLFGGTHQTLVDNLQIAPGAEGYDLDGDGYIDNTLAPLGALANSEIRSGFTEGDIIIAFELFGLDDGQSDECLNLSVVVGLWPPDMDDDGERTGALVRDAEHDCNDWDSEIRPDASEIAGDGVDNDCNGWADETLDASGNVVPSSDDVDQDGDGYSPADGDCDDRLLADWPTAPDWWDPADIHPDADEVCGDGFDNNCDGVADEGCDPYSTTDGADERIPVDPNCLTEDQGESNMVFRSARIVDGRLVAGPSVFAFGVDIDGHPTNLIISWAQLEADVTMGTYGLELSDGLLGGVLSAHHMDAIPNIASGVLGEEDNTLLDTLVGPAGIVLNLPTIGVCRERDIEAEWLVPITVCDSAADCGDTSVYRCDIEIRAPDIDMDGDGIEIFLDSNLDGDPDTFRVDTCVDGDGTIFYDELDGDGQVITECSAATDGQGQPLFPDGFSIAMRLSSMPTTLYGIAAP